MNKATYKAGIYLYCAVLVIVAIDASLFATHGLPIFRDPMTRNWLAGSLVVVLMAEGVLLKYYLFKGYLLAFISNLVALIVSTVEFVVFYRGGNSDLNYIVLVSLSLLCIYSVVLMYSKASERVLLKKAGFYGLLLGLSLLALVIIMLNTKDAEIVRLLDNIYMTISLSGYLILLLLIQTTAWS